MESKRKVPGSLNPFEDCYYEYVYNSNGGSKPIGVRINLHVGDKSFATEFIFASKSVSVMDFKTQEISDLRRIKYSGEKN